MAKFGWCLGMPRPHLNCRYQYVSSVTGKTITCDCPCHTENEKALKELI